MQQADRMKSLFQCGRFQLDLATPHIMGIVNVTDDSFSGDGLAGNVKQAIEQGQAMVADGAHVLDLGAESSRPGAPAVSLQQELDRLIPVIEGLRECGVPLSVDTVKPEVMRAAIGAGADLINDIRALSEPGALEAVAASGVGVCLMHMRGEPRTMQNSPQYGDVVAEVRQYLAQRVDAAVACGIERSRIMLDPGFGFGKALEHNLALLRHFDAFAELKLPLLAGMSRKSMLGQLTGRGVDQRLASGLAAHLLAVAKGARVVRVHDIAAMRDALVVWQAIEAAG